MKLKQIEKPSVEPITLDEAKTHLRVTNSEEDTSIESLIQTAREKCELISNRSYIQQKWKLSFDDWPDFPVELPRPPLRSVEKIEYKDKDGNISEWNTDNYIVDDQSFVPQIYLSDDYEFPSDDLYPANSVIITYQAGYEPDDSGDTTDYRANVPARYKHAIKLLIGEWYDNRAEIVNTGAVPQSIKNGVKALLGADRVVPL